MLMKYDTIDARISPEGRLDVLSKVEVNRLLDTSQGGLYKLFRNCSLAVLSSGNRLDDGKELLERYQSFDIQVIQEERGIKLEVKGAPASAFVDGKLIRGINEHLFAVLRDVIYVSDEINDNPKFDLESSAGITNAVFHILRNANILRPTNNPRLVVCWGGHSITPVEYDYSKEVGYQMGLRGLDICTGCGQGAMKGPDERGHYRARQAAYQQRSVPWHLGTRDYCCRATQSYCERSRYSSGYRETSGGLCPHCSCHCGLSRWRRDG